MTPLCEASHMAGSEDNQQSAEKISQTRISANPTLIAADFHAYKSAFIRVRSVVIRIPKEFFITLLIRGRALLPEELLQ